MKVLNANARNIAFFVIRKEYSNNIIVEEALFSDLANISKVARFNTTSLNYTSMTLNI